MRRVDILFTPKEPIEGKVEKITMQNNDTDGRNYSGNQCPCTPGLSFNKDHFTDWIFAGTWSATLLATLVICGLVIVNAWRVWDKQPAYFLLLINFSVAQLFQAVSWVCLVIANIVPDHTDQSSACNVTVTNPLGYNAGQVAGMVGRLSSFTSLLIKTAVSVELYYYFCLALQYNKALALRRAQTLVIGAWVVGMVVAAGYFIWPSQQPYSELLSLQVLYLTKMDKIWWVVTIVMLVICGGILAMANIRITMSTCNIIFRDRQTQVTLQHIHQRNNDTIPNLMSNNPHVSLQRVAEVNEVTRDGHTDYIEPAIAERSPSQCSIRSQVTVQIMPSSPTNVGSNTIDVVVSHELPVIGQASSISTCCSIENNELYLSSNRYKNTSLGSTKTRASSHAMIPRIEVISPSTIGCGSSCSDKTSTYKGGSITTCGDEFNLSMSSNVTGPLRSYDRQAQILEQENIDSQNDISEAKQQDTVKKQKIYSRRQPIDFEPHDIETMQGNAKVNNWFSSEKGLNFGTNCIRKKQIKTNTDGETSQEVPPPTNAVRLSNSQSLSRLSILDFLMQDISGRDATTQGGEPQPIALHSFAEGGEGLEEQGMEDDIAPFGSLCMRLAAIVARLIYILVMFTGQWVSPFIMLALQASLCPPPEWSYKLWWTLMLATSPIQIAYYTALNRDITRAMRHFGLPCRKHRIHPNAESATS